MARLFISIGSLFLVLMLAVAAPAQDKTDDKSQEKAPADTSAGDKTPADPYAVPEGTPAEIMAYVQNIIRNMPQDDPSRKKARAAMLKAAEKMLSGAVYDNELDFAVEVKMLSLDKHEDIRAFGEELKKSGREKQARSVQNYLLETTLHDAIRDGKPELQKKQIDAVIKYFDETPPQPNDLRLAIMVGQVAELQGDNAYAADIYKKMSKTFSGSKFQQLEEFAKRLDGVVRRLSLPGNKMKLEGKYFSGGEFDFAPYQGKVVLVDFWASWRQSCASDVPKLKKLYDLYHDKDFEIIGIACDYRREDVARFVKLYELPWPTVYADKGPSPTFEYYGILTFPTMILLDKDGKVIELNVTTDELPKKLEKLLAPAEKK
jgi:thiol-disulfide isomerase/thioredoxin